MDLQYSSVLGLGSETESLGLGTCWPVSLAKWADSRLSEKPCPPK